MTTVYSSKYNEDDKAEALDILEQITDKKVDRKVVFDRYTQISHQYEKAMVVINYNGPRETAATVAQLFPSNRNNVCMLDVAAGTGLCAIELNNYNFLELDALDASEGMLLEAKKKKLYGRYIIDVLGENALDINDDTYDAVIICGLSTDIMRRLPIQAFETLIRIVKKGVCMASAFLTTIINVSNDIQHCKLKIFYKIPKRKTSLQSLITKFMSLDIHIVCLSTLISILT
ncbi:uncharacterized protein LOC124148250 isoform X3 [Haliotis rufescens]|nr:uncharacterized protein LOC124148250 isoform X3 [Haliotis rufescens]